jgi:hypothetical protein
MGLIPLKKATTTLLIATVITLDFEWPDFSEPTCKQNQAPAPWERPREAKRHRTTRSTWRTSRLVLLDWNRPGQLGLLAVLGGAQAIDLRGGFWRLGTAGDEDQARQQ